MYPPRCSYKFMFQVVLCGLPLLVLAASVTSAVVSVLDGDTIEVLNGYHAERIRLNGIDWPEKSQSYGKKAKQAASELVFGKEVTRKTFGKD
jgi:endonuclease YncB( thermonuclease family)